MFEPIESPRIFGLPPGTDFPSSLVDGVLARQVGARPEALARVTILVNTRRMQRRLRTLFAEGPPRLLPRILLVTELQSLMPEADVPAPTSPLRRRLELSALVGKLIEQNPGLAPRSAAVDLAESLASLMDEMQGEAVPPEALLSLDIGDQSDHWQQSLRFLSIVRQFMEVTPGSAMDPEARSRHIAELVTKRWATNPPKEPIIVAGSTGSRATTSLIMQAVAKLPQGAVILPGFDFDMPSPIFAQLTNAAFSPLGAEDHPQYRFAKLLDVMKMQKADVLRWDQADPQGKRNSLISLSLRPAPVTDQWLEEGPRLGDLGERTQGMTLLEAPSPKDEALAIAVALREAVEEGVTAALITPDRTLGRRVTAALSRWDIVPDDSAGRPLSLTAPGRFLRQVATMVGRAVDPVDLFALLKHPLSRSSDTERGPHLRLSREFEIFVRREKIAVITQDSLKSFRKERKKDELSWCDWLQDWLGRVAEVPAPTLSDGLTHHLALAELMSSGGRDDAGQLWEQTAGRDTLMVIDRFRAESDYRHPLPFAEYVRLFDKALSAESTRNYDTARPDIMIWGTLEARVQGAELVILGGLNEGTWPETPDPDPWLNRPLRRQVGLLLPERRIGLSAHDFQQAAAARRVILSRSKRDDDSETVPSRWLSRLTNLLEGLKSQNGPETVRSMRAAGQRYLEIALLLDQPSEKLAPAPRPAPAPPLAARPTDYTVTEIQTLIRDPFAIYAHRILGLRRLDPLRIQPDARIRGEIFHNIVEEAFAIDADFSDITAAVDRLRGISNRHLAALPWPGVAAHWRGHLEAIAERLVVDEQARRQAGHPIALERKGRVGLPGTEFSIRGKADRIDILNDGRLAIYDYKTGNPPTADQLQHYDRQLPIEALMAELGAFEDIAARPVAHVTHIGLGRTPKNLQTELVESGKNDFRTETISRELALLLSSYHTSTKGYPSRRAMEKLRWDGDYDHLARFGEWDETVSPTTERLP